jgi:hypothetical protein
MGGDTPMAIHANPEAMTHWYNLVRDEERNGKIPLPAVDSIRLEAGQPPVIALVAPNIIPGATHIFVDLVTMPPDDRVTAEALLLLIEEAARWLKVPGRVRAIYHAGGLDYDFSGDDTVRLKDVASDLQAEIWGLLHALAMIGAKYPDQKASTVKSVAG